MTMAFSQGNSDHLFHCEINDGEFTVLLDDEEIHYKLMAGDTTNLSEKEKSWYFHTKNPDLDLDVDLNPHFDSLEGLHEETVVNQDPYGLDCVLIFSCGPFDLAVGEEVPFSFCII